MDEPQNQEKPEPTGFWAYYSEGKPETPMEWVQCVFTVVGLSIAAVMVTILLVMVAIYLLPIALAVGAVIFIIVIFFRPGDGGGGPPDVHGPTPM